MVRSTHLLFHGLNGKVAVSCMCGWVSEPTDNATMAWALWRKHRDGEDQKPCTAPRGKIIQVPGPERIVVKEVPVERVVVEERRIYLCHQCNRTFDEGEGFETHRIRCAQELRQRTVAMLEEEIRRLGLQDRLRVRP